jgi:PAS domain S-box-containing protein
MEDPKCKVLLIEDDKLDRRAFVRMVEQEKLPYDCTAAESVSQGMEELRSHKYDVVIVDYLLGDGTAFDILPEVKDTPIVFVTGAGDEEVALKAWKAGVSDYLIKDADRRYLKALPITVDSAISRRLMEERLRLLSAAMMCTTDSVYIADVDNKIVFVNGAFCETYGYTEAEVIGKDASIFCEQSPFETEARGILADVSSREVGFWHKRKDGTEFQVSVTRSVIQDENGKEVGLVSVIRDISQNVVLEDKIRSLNRKFRNQSSVPSP